ncbi:ribonuclease E/G [Oceaniovalibus sp. ACAM 378]|uniref:ribonuclease E/G n=1 Tax=Oceaniovalibus sp. ACAM 378 TaxID=2599923 RepID=UPI0011D2F743|nr:ribonuclease E/G [Oceaniovalibus sp. ACAM 378]TYB85823.1 ribonuclease G [Oceaniovalibus sp. ACAM 378]
MKGSSVVLDRIGDRLAAAMVIDGVLHDLLIEPSEARPVPGAIYRAVVDRPMKGQGGAIVRMPDGRGYLRGAKGLAPGTVMLVQVTGYAEDGKAVPVTDRVLFKSRYAIVTPGAPGINISRTIREEDRREQLLLLAHETVDDGTGLILRSACATGSDEAIAEDVRAMCDLASAIMAEVSGPPELLVEGPDPHTLAWREWPEPDSISTQDGGFAAQGIDAMIAALARPGVAIGEGRMFIEPTRALVAVDVNTGADTSLSAGLKANIAMARALPAQLRCRGLGGQIVLDLAPMAKKERRGFEQVLRAAFRADSIDTVLAGWTPLGLFELQRRRDRLPLEALP